MVGTYYGDSSDLMLPCGSNFLCFYSFSACPCFNLAPGPSCFCVGICKRRANLETVSSAPYLLAIH